MKLVIVLSLLLMSVFLGGIIVSMMQRAKNEKLIKLLLAFSGGFLLSIAFIHFIPEMYETTELNVGLFILSGFLIQLVLEFFSGGIEHGHVHIHKNAPVPYGLLIALSIHSIIEGIPLGSQLAGHEITSSHHHGDDNSLLLGILFHQLPVAIALMTLLTASNASKLKVWILLGVFAITVPIGVIFGLVSHEYFAGFDLTIVLAIVVGMFLHISTTIIFETTENHKFNLVKLMSIFIGCALAFFMH